ncbi:hypothetical protein N9269_04635, partial [Akkermansiaceae bacterium]|nr:hypothetical protein [Akkermansiaceae bacterium]
LKLPTPPGNILRTPYIIRWEIFVTRLCVSNMGVTPTGLLSCRPKAASKPSHQKEIAGSSPEH